MMKRTASLLAGLCLAGIASLILPATARADDSYQLLKEIKIGGDGGWDYLSLDEGARRLYVTHATKIVVVDLDKENVIGEIADTPGVHGFALAPSLHRGFSSNGQEAKVSVVDLGTLSTLSKVPTGEKPDAILFEPGQKEVYAFNGRSNSVTIFAADSGKVVATTALSGKPEFAACDPAAGRVYCNIEDQNEVAVIDAKTHAVVHTWPISPGESASGMAIDTAHHRLFLGCHNKLMVMMDSTDGKIVATVPIGSGVDANAFDPGAQLAFSSNGDGTVTIAREDSSEKLTVLQNLATERGARTMALDPKTHRIYLATAQFKLAEDPKSRPKPVPGTLKILVYGKK